VNVVIAEPPVAPAVYATVADAAPAVAVPIVGACGTVVAVIEFDAAEAADVPELFVAVTVNVYKVDDCKPVTVTGEEEPVPVNPPGLEVAVNEVAVAPAAGVNVTVAAPLLNERPVPTFVAVPIVGIPGLPFAEEAYIPMIGIRRYRPQLEMNLKKGT
jgi:hypothetical protein